MWSSLRATISPAQPGRAETRPWSRRASAGKRLPPPSHPSDMKGKKDRHHSAMEPVAALFTFFSLCSLFFCHRLCRFLFGLFLLVLTFSHDVAPLWLKYRRHLLRDHKQPTQPPPIYTPHRSFPLRIPPSCRQILPVLSPNTRPFESVDTDDVSPGDLSTRKKRWPRCW